MLLNKSFKIFDVNVEKSFHFYLLLHLKNSKLYFNLWLCNLGNIFRGTEL